MKQKLNEEYPHLQIAGMEPLPPIELKDVQDEKFTPDEELIQKINSSGAGLVMVCLGCPKQEYWMKQHLGKIQAVMLGVGAVFEVYAGIHKRAPDLMRNLGFEWFYRLIQEPHRLWKRYSETIPPFIWLALLQLIKKPQDLLSNISLNDNFFETIALDSKPAQLGEILLRQEAISKTSLTKALDEQRSKSRKLGEILVEQGELSQEELDYFLKNQNTRLGDILIRNKIISVEKLSQFLDEQKTTDRRLGEILVQKNVLPSESLKPFLLEQYYRKKGFWLTPKSSY